MISFSPQLIRNSIVLVILIFFVLTVYWGWGAGKNIAISRHTVSTVTTLDAGLRYFWDDQGRFPSTAEFSNTEVMRKYFDHFPPQELTAKLCPKTYAYNTNAGKTYEVIFCIPRAVGSFSAGTNQVTDTTRLGN